MTFSKLSVVPLPDTRALVNSQLYASKTSYTTVLQVLTSTLPGLSIVPKSYSLHLRSRLMHSKTFKLMPPKRLTQLQILALTLTNSQSYPNHTLVHLRSRLSCIHSETFNLIPQKRLTQLQILALTLILNRIQTIF